MGEWNYIITGLSVILLSLLLWQEVKRADKRRLMWRIIASVIAVISLACVALPIRFTARKTFDETKQIVLLTEGFTRDSVQSFLNKSPDQKVVYTTDPAVFKSAKLFNPKFITGVDIIDRTPAIHVFGYGLNEDELKKLNKIPLIFHRNEMPIGITAINWQRKLQTGEKLSVQGSFNNNLSDPVKLVLNGLNTNLDSVIISANSRKFFHLTTVPKHLDRAVYHVFAVGKNDTVEVEDLPVEVKQTKPISILVLAASPDFENKFLKNRLSQNGYAVAIRSRISKNIFQTGFANTRGISLENISASVLDKFDVLVADATELAAISKSELQTIQSAVQKGVGMIVKADSSIRLSSFYGRNTALIKGRVNTNKATVLYIKTSGDTVPGFVIEHPVYVRSATGTQSLIQDGNGAVLANKTIYGKGRIIISTLQNTYALQLSGNQKYYDEVWSALLNNAAKKTAFIETVTVSPALPRLHEPMRISIQTDLPTTEPVQLGVEQVYLKQDPLLPFMHSGTYWPTEAGWLPQVDIEGNTNWLYVYESTDWATVKAGGTLAAANRYEQENIPGISEKKNVEKDVPVSVPPIYFFIIFIISSGFLWFEKKLS